MSRLVLVVAGVLAILVALDRAVPRLLRGERALDAVAAEGEDTYRRRTLAQFQALRGMGEAQLARIRRRWEALPEEKAPDELRIFIIGNSAAIFSIVPALVERRVAEALPDRRVSVVPLLFPQIKIQDELILVRAAIARHADVVVLTPNLAGMRTGPSHFREHIAENYGSPGTDGARGPAAAVRLFLLRHWRLYADRDDLRQLTLGVLAHAGALEALSGAATRAVDGAFETISAAAARGDFAAIVATFRAHRMQALMAPALFRPEPPTSPVFATARTIAAEVRAAGVLGIAIFLPVNPIFRDPRAAAGFERYRLDDAPVRRLVAHTLGIYRAAGFVTADRLDALPAADFFDLLHANGEGLRVNTDAVAAIVASAVERKRR
jgi:hypothetical protein